jgi:prevent-host-death family protein
MRKSIGIREAKAHFSEYIALVRAGNEVTVTDRGRPVVRLVAIHAKVEPKTEQEIMLQLEESGAMERGAVKPRAVRAPSKVSKPQDIAALVRAQRR